MAAIPGIVDSHMQQELGFAIPLFPETTRTGHIDLLQMRNGRIRILDYKPNAVRDKSITQRMLYALALSRRTGLRLYDFVCAWFDEHHYFAFYPLHVVHKRGHCMVWVPLRRSASSYEQHAESKNGRYHPRDKEPESPITRGAGEELRQAGAQRGRGLHAKDEQHHTDNEQGHPDDALYRSLLRRCASIMRKEARGLLRIVSPAIIELCG